MWENIGILILQLKAQPDALNMINSKFVFVINDHNFSNINIWVDLKENVSIHVTLTSKCNVPLKATLKHCTSGGHWSVILYLRVM